MHEARALCILPTLPTAASPRSTSFTLLLGFGPAASDILYAVECSVWCGETVARSVGSDGAWSWEERDEEEVEEEELLAGLV